MVVSEENVYNRIFKIFCQSCTVKVTESGITRYVRSKLLIFYHIVVCLAFPLAYYQARLTKLSSMQIISRSTNYTIQVFSVLASWATDVQYRELFDRIARLKHEKYNKMCRKAIINKNLICMSVIMIMIVMSGCFYVQNWTTQKDKISGIQMIDYFVFIILLVSYCKVAYMVLEFTQRIGEINLEAKDNLSSWSKMTEILIRFSEYELMLLEMNEVLNPLLLCNVTFNFLAMCTMTYVFPCSFFNDSHPIILQLVLASEVIRFIILTSICEKLHENMVEFWQLIDSKHLAEMEKRAIMEQTLKDMKVNVYNIFSIDNGYKRAVYITTLNYGIFMMLNCEPLQNYIIEATNKAKL